MLGGVLFLQKDLGMLMLFVLSCLIILLISGLPARHFAKVAGAAVAAGAGFVLLRHERILAWLAPMDHLDGAGYHIMNCKLAIARGAGLGLGVGQSPEKWYSLPFPQTDSIFCVWAAETGLWGTFALLLVFAALAWYTYTVASRATNPVHSLLAAGCGFLVCTQAAVNMAVATNLIPPTGLTLPFVSYGRTSLVGSALAIAVVLWVAQRTRPQKPAQSQTP